MSQELRASDPLLVQHRRIPRRIGSPNWIACLATICSLMRKYENVSDHNRPLIISGISSENGITRVMVDKDLFDDVFSLGFYVFSYFLKKNQTLSIVEFLYPD